MTKISRIKVDSKELGFFLNNFWSVITLLEDKEQVKDFLKALLTHTEMKMFAKRIQIAKMLLEGYTYKEIKSRVKVTDSTVSRMSNVLELNGDGLKTAIKYLQKVELEIDKKRIEIAPDIKKSHSMYFLPEIIVEEIGKTMRKRKKRNSVKKNNLL